MRVKTKKNLKTAGLVVLGLIALPVIIKAISKKESSTTGTDYWSSIPTSVRKIFNV
jgi:hypothetical protein